MDFSALWLLEWTHIETTKVKSVAMRNTLMLRSLRFSAFRRREEEDVSGRDERRGMGVDIFARMLCIVSGGVDMLE